MSSLISDAKRTLKARKGDDGFTLIELLIVIVVLGILAAIVVLGLSTFKESATGACNGANAKQVQTATDAATAWNANPANEDNQKEANDFLTTTPGDCGA